MFFLNLSTGLFMVATSVLSALGAVAILLAAGRKQRGAIQPGAVEDVEDKGQHGVETIPTTPATPTDSPAVASVETGEICDLSPMLIWKEDEQGNIRWANRPYREMAGVPAAEDPQTADLPAIFGKSEPEPGQSRASLDLPGQEKTRWYEVIRAKMSTGEMLNYALPADPLIQAEEALRNFVQTLTMTFSHLPIGLAIFDRNRQLALFNPALANLTTLEPEWLSERPTLYAFLDRLREYRRIPEPKDYRSWRERIVELEKAAEDGTYEEHWPLPTGQTFKVTGRPHPEGAVAFLFEDITAAITLQRQFRSELALHQAVLDGFDAALAVFAPNGDLVMNNDAFVALWGVDPSERLMCMDITEALSLWQRSCKPSITWQRVAHFAANPSARREIRDCVESYRGGKLELRFKPLARGAFLCLFHPHVANEAQEVEKSLARA
jgi:hypothetical protein